jgi:hypothetical protein
VYPFSVPPLPYAIAQHGADAKPSDARVAGPDNHIILVYYFILFK